MGSHLSHVNEENKLIQTENVQLIQLDLPKSINQHERTRHEIETISNWKNILANDPNNKSLRGMFWYQAIGNDLNISWNAYNEYKVAESDAKDANESSNQMKSIFASNNCLSHKRCEGLRRKNSIKRDLQRMYEYNSYTKTEEIECILMAYCNYNKNISYTQFMAHLVEILLEYQNNKMCFISLCNILNYELFDMFLHFDMNKLQKRINVFKKILYFNSKELGLYLNEISIKQNINHLFDGYIIDCIQTLFSRQLCIDIVCKIWDLYFEFGEIIIWKCAVLLFLEINRKLLIVQNKRDINYIMNVLQSIDKTMIDIDTDCFINSINLITIPNDINQLFN
eukprot:154802_1